MFKYNIRIFNKKFSFSKVIYKKSNSKKEKEYDAIIVKDNPQLEKSNI